MSVENKFQIKNRKVTYAVLLSRQTSLRPLRLPTSSLQISEIWNAIDPVASTFGKLFDRRCRFPIEFLDEVSADQVAGPINAVSAVDSHHAVLVLVQSVVDDLEKLSNYIFVRKCVAFRQNLEMFEF